MGPSFDFRMAFSFYPAFDKNTVIFRENLLGTWFSEKRTSDEEALIIEKGDTLDDYILTLKVEFPGGNTIQMGLLRFGLVRLRHIIQLRPMPRLSQGCSLMISSKLAMASGS